MRAAELGASRARQLAFRTSLLRAALREQWLLEDEIGVHFGTLGDALKAARLLAPAAPAVSAATAEMGQLANWARHAPRAGGPCAAPRLPAGAVSAAGLEEFRGQLYGEAEAKQEQQKADVQETEASGWEYYWNDLWDCPCYCNGKTGEMVWSLSQTVADETEESFEGGGTVRVQSELDTLNEEQLGVKFEGVGEGSMQRTEAVGGLESRCRAILEEAVQQSTHRLSRNQSAEKDVPETEQKELQKELGQALQDAEGVCEAIEASDGKGNEMGTTFGIS